MANPRDLSVESHIDRLALSRAQHLQRQKSLSDDEHDPISDWSDSDRECSSLSDVEWTANDLPMANASATPVPIIDDSATSTRISFNNELERPKVQYIKKQQTSPGQTFKHLPAPLLPGRRAQSKGAIIARRPSIRSTTTSQSSFSSRTTKTPLTLPSRLNLRRETTSTSTSFNTYLTKDSRLSPNSSIHSHEKSLCDDLMQQRRNLSPNPSQLSAPRVYEVKKLFADETDYGRLTDATSTKGSPARSRQKWGTIVHPPFPLGYQHIAPEQVNQVVERLASPVRCRDRHRNVQSPSKRYLSVEETEALVS